MLLSDGLRDEARNALKYAVVAPLILDDMEPEMEEIGKISPFLRRHTLVANACSISCEIWKNREAP